MNFCKQLSKNRHLLFMFLLNFIQRNFQIQQIYFKHQLLPFRKVEEILHLSLSEYNYLLLQEAATKLEETTTTKKPEPITTKRPETSTRRKKRRRTTTTTKRPETSTQLTTSTSTQVASTTEKFKCKPDSCQQLCDDNDGVIRCYCESGYRLQDDKKTCKGNISRNLFQSNTRGLMNTQF